MILLFIMVTAYITQKNKRLTEKPLAIFWCIQKSLIFKNHNFSAVGTLADKKYQFSKTKINWHKQMHGQKFSIFKNNK